MPIHASQAGERVRCTCGADLEVPTMREIASLEQERAGPVASRPAARWGIRQRVLLAGAVLTLAGVLLGAVRYYLRPVQMEVADYPPWMALNLWVVLQQGVDRPPHPLEIAFERQVRIYHQWMGVAAALVVLGLLTTASSLVVDRVVAGRSRPGGGR